METAIRMSRPRRMIRNPRRMDRSVDTIVTQAPLFDMAFYARQARVSDAPQA